MINLVVTTRDGQGHKVLADAGVTLLEAIRSGGIDDLLALCGGSCSCATCHVVIDPSRLDLMDPASSDEDDLLDGADNRVLGSRLSCQILLDHSHEGLQVRIAPE